MTGVGGEDREERRFETYNIRGRTASPVEADCAHSRKQRPSVRGPKFNFVLNIDRFIMKPTFYEMFVSRRQIPWEIKAWG